VRLLTVVAPEGAAAAAAPSEALAAWTRGLDIRLRFLNIGVEETVLAPPEPAAGAPAAAALAEVERAVDRLEPSVLLLHGRGPVALAAALSAAKAGVPVVRTAAGLRDGPAGDEDRAADRLAAARLAPGAAALEALGAEGLDGTEFTPEAAVRAVLRLQRETGS
jgi:hypothetical protein